MKKILEVLLVFLISYSSFAAGNSEAILAQLKSNDKEIKGIVGTDKKVFTAAQKNKIRSLFDRFFDFEQMSAEILKDHWKGLSAAQKKSFVSSFSTLLKESSLRDLSLYQSKIVYKKVKFENDIALANLYAIRNDKRVKIIYKMSQLKNEQWAIFDFLLDGVSTVESYRTSFDRIVREKSFDTLISKIKKKIAKLKSKV